MARANRPSPGRGQPVQLRFETELTAEEYVSREAWRNASFPPCLKGLCGFDCGLMRAILFARAAAASFSGCSASILLSQGSSEFRAPARMTEHGRCARDKQLTEAALPHPCDPAEPLPSRGRAPPQGQPGLGREVTPAFEALHRRREGVNRHRADRPDAGDCHQPPEFLAFPRPGATQRHGTSHSRQQLLPPAGPGQRMAELPSRLDVLLPPGIVVLDARR